MADLQSFDYLFLLELFLTYLLQLAKTIITQGRQSPQLRMRHQCLRRSRRRYRCGSLNARPLHVRVPDQYFAAFVEKCYHGVAFPHLYVEFGMF